MNIQILLLKLHLPLVLVSESEHCFYLYICLYCQCCVKCADRMAAYFAPFETFKRVRPLRQSVGESNVCSVRAFQRLINSFSVI